MTTRMRTATNTADEQRLLEQPGMLLGLPDMQVRALQGVQLRVDDSGDGPQFKGYAVRWDVVDSYGTTFAPGSFRDGGLDGSEYALLWMHDPYSPLGMFTAREDSNGLLIEGSWDATPEGQAKRVMAKSSAPGLSVGFVPLMVDPEDENRFTQARLVETSQITLRMASVPGAEFTSSRISSQQQRERKLAVDVALARLALAHEPARLG